MRSPFPGMNPYLENSELWSEVHSRLIVAIADDLSDRLSEKYRVAIEKRTYFSGGDQPPQPPLSQDDLNWLTMLLKEEGDRSE